MASILLLFSRLLHDWHHKALPEIGRLVPKGICGPRIFNLPTALWDECLVLLLVPAPPPDRGWDLGCLRAAAVCMSPSWDGKAVLVSRRPRQCRTRVLHTTSGVFCSGGQTAGRIPPPYSSRRRRGPYSSKVPWGKGGTVRGGTTGMDSVMHALPFYNMQERRQLISRRPTKRLGIQQSQHSGPAVRSFWGSDEVALATRERVVQNSQARTRMKIARDTGHRCSRWLDGGVLRRHWLPMVRRRLPMASSGAALIVPWMRGWKVQVSPQQKNGR